MTNEQLTEYYNQTKDKGNCMLVDSKCPLREHCNGLARNKCKEFTPIDHHWVIDEIIKSYHRAEEEEFVKRYIH